MKSKRNNKRNSKTRKMKGGESLKDSNLTPNVVYIRSNTTNSNETVNNDDKPKKDKKDTSLNLNNSPGVNAIVHRDPTQNHGSPPAMRLHGSPPAMRLHGSPPGMRSHGSQNRSKPDSYTKPIYRRLNPNPKLKDNIKYIIPMIQNEPATQGLVYNTRGLNFGRRNLPKKIYPIYFDYDKNYKRKYYILTVDPKNRMTRKEEKKKNNG